MSEIEYFRVGDYLPPSIKLSDPPNAPPLSKCGQMHKAYLWEHRPTLCSALLLSEKLYPLCRVLDASAQEQLRCGVPEEVILSEVVYA